MPPIDSLVVLSTATLAGLGLLAGVAAWGWSGWLKFRHAELDTDRRQQAHDLPAVGQRIDLADLKERIRKLEAIAAGVDW